MLILVLLHINMRVLTHGLNVALSHGADCKASMYKHEHKAVWVDYSVQCV